MKYDEFVKELEVLGIDVSDDVLEKLDIYCKFLLAYNKHTNLTAIKEEKDVYLKHFLDSLTITKVIDLTKYNTLLDIGAGAGFPGMVIACFFPNLTVTLVDSNGKKIKFLEELKNKLNIENVEIIYDRVENIYGKYLNYFDIVTSRAVAEASVLVELAMPLVRRDGYFVLMKGSNREEVLESKYAIEKLNGEVVNDISFNLYNNENLRNIVLIKKKILTNINNIRSYEKIIKKPLKKINK